MTNAIVDRIFKTRDSTIYFVILTIISLVILSYGNYTISKTTNKTSAYITYTLFIIAIYIVFFGIHFFDWSLENIFSLILVVSVILSVVAFLIIYFSKTICEDLEKTTTSEYMGYLLIFLELIVLYLGFYNRTQYTSWNTYDLIRFIIALIIIRIMYYITTTYNKPLYKTINDITLALIIYLYGNRLYKVATLPQQQ